MLNPFLLMAVFYLLIALVAAVDAALTSFSLIPWFVGLPWLRVHFVALGVLTEAAFGVLPAFVAAHRTTEPPATRWDQWLLLNAGLVVLLAGVPSVTASLIIAGGTLVFVAVILLVVQLRGIGGARSARSAGSGSLKFYVAGLIFLLVGILIGTGLWVGWSEPLHIDVPKEAHIHANVWGFAALIFAGLLVDLLPALTGAALAGRRAINAIFAALAMGALVLLLVPWLGVSRVATAPGLALTILGTVGLVIALVRNLRRAGLYAHAGAWHLTLAYAWILVPAAVTPLIVLGAYTVPSADVEATAPQTLIYGWILQFLYAATPYFAARWLLRDPAARLGGNWLSLAAINLGGILIWGSILLADLRGPLHAAAYLLLGVSIVAAGWETAAIALAALRRSERQAAHTP